MPELSWNEIRTRAYTFINEWKDYRGKEIAETQTFWNNFFNVFGVKRRSVAVYEKSVAKLNGNTGRIDLFWPGKLLVEQKQQGRSLEEAKKQAFDYFHGLKEKEKPRYVISCDFSTFMLIDLEAKEGKDEEVSFQIEELPKYIDRFYFIAGYAEEYSYADLDIASIEAAQLMAGLYEAILKINSADSRLDLFMVRLLYCLFADDTEIFRRDSFKRYLNERTHEDGSDLGLHLGKIFQVLNTPEERRGTALDEQLNIFPYINGGLFEEVCFAPDFDSATRRELLKVCSFDWSEINPSIFGSLFQDISDPVKRRTLGEHYTSNGNILKTLHPLFLDGLKEKFTKAGDNKNKLEALLSELSGLTFLDPACGCGNFLVVAYRELRLLELEILKKLHKAEKSLLPVEGLSGITVEQFYGIEIAPFPAKIAQVALWLTDHQMNLKLGQAFGRYYARIPLTQSPHITCANALRTDWGSVVNVRRLSYIVGNPPFVGSKYKSEMQQEESQVIFTNVKSAGVLDYVANWYKKAADIMRLNTGIVTAFVSTNSITQGQQVAPLWLPLLHDYKAKIHFAHRTFMWDNEAGDKAHVHCVIIGFALYDIREKRLWDYPDIKGEGNELRVTNINPYLLAADDIIVEARKQPLEHFTFIMNYGSAARDDVNFFFTEQEMQQFIKQEPQAKRFIRPVLGAEEFINNKKRYCLWLKLATPSELKAMPLVRKKVEAVRKFRLESKKISNNKDANTPTLFAEDRQPESDYLLIPSVSSERRTYIPIGYVNKEVIVTNACYFIPNATPYLFGVLASLMHMTWTKYVCGRLESRYRYSNTIVYNNFPFPHNPSAAAVAKVEAAAQALLTLRQGYLDNGESYATLYDPDLMPGNLFKAHQLLDKAVDACYAGQKKFDTELERIGFLFAEYRKRTDPLFAGH
jgi:hypothetical protein